MRTTAIVPVFNEERTIKNLLSTLDNSVLIEEMVVVFEREILGKLEVIFQRKNLGKAGAVRTATKHLKTDILFFCPGDLINFKKEHIKQILKPFNYDDFVKSLLKGHFEAQSAETISSDNISQKPLTS
jgi:molybdopterin-guanine dinucleotide biosynthesis protein A